MSPYILLAGKIDTSELSVLAVNQDKEQLRSYAQTYVEKHAGSVVHIFSWEDSYWSNVKVEVERLWTLPEAYVVSSLLSPSVEPQSD